MLIKFVAAIIVAALFSGAYFLPKDGEKPFGKTAVPMIALPATTEMPATIPDNPVELGAVRWTRDLDLGLDEAKKSGKPALILFQEVPGCSNCTQFGSSTLSHPLIVEAIETYFVPICIYNNKGGKDGAALQRFDEPSWNNPVVRIVRADGQDIVPRMAKFQSAAQLVNGLRRALDLSGAVVPSYLELLEEELQAREAGLATATFAMHCFWVGEGTFGAIPGVIETEAGFQDGREVVRVSYNPAILQKDRLEELAEPKGMKACSRNDGFRADREPKYYLAQTTWKYVPMSALQACRANSLIGQNKSPETVLSARQIELQKYVREHAELQWPDAIGARDLGKAWTAVEKVKKG